MKKSLGLIFLLSPVLVWIIRFVVSLFFRVMTNTQWAIDPTSLLMTIKLFINRILWVLWLVSVVLFVVWIVLMATSKDNKIKTWEVIKYAWKESKKNTTKYLLWFWIYILLTIVSWIFDTETNILGSHNLSIVITTLLQVLWIWIGLWLTKISLDIVYKRQYKIKNLFVWFIPFLKFIWAYILTLLIVIVGYILLIIPGIIRWVRLNFVAHLVLEKNLSPLKAIKASWKMTKGLVGNILWLNIVAWLINILWLLCLVVWLIWTIPVVIIANAYLYKKISEIK